MDRQMHKRLLQMCTVCVVLSCLDYSIITTCLAAVPLLSEARKPKTEPALLVISYDGFRPEYLNRNVTPHMNKFRKDGTAADFMYNVFPTKTFVNHHSIATGFYPMKHGVLANSLYDSKLGKLNYGYDLFHFDESIWPIWTANEKAGKHSGCMMWPGNHYKYDGTTCTFSVAFNMSVPLKERIDIVMTWFLHKKTPANFVLVYIEQPDEQAHMHSPDSKMITDMVAELDNLTNYIQQKLVENQLEQRVNVIHLSDHGMSSVSPPNFINLTDFVRNETVTFYGTSPVLQVVPKNMDMLDEIYANLTKAALQNGHFNVYTPHNLPDRWNATNAQRMGPILAVAAMQYAFQDLHATAEFYRDTFKLPITPRTRYGVHGYDNAEELMHAFFMAKGPLFASGKTLEPFSTVDLYNLFCAILRIHCKPNEGADRTSTWNVLLRKPIKPLHSRGAQEPYDI